MNLKDKLPLNQNQFLDIANLIEYDKVFTVYNEVYIHYVLKIKSCGKILDFFSLASLVDRPLFILYYIQKFFNELKSLG
jgi:hypothetical protein